MKQHTKPIYKRTWFIVTVLILVIGVISSTSKDERAALDKERAAKTAIADSLKQVEIDERTPSDWLNVYLDDQAKSIDIRALRAVDGTVRHR